MKVVYVVEDHEVIRSGVVQYLSLSGYEAKGFKDLQDARVGFAEKMPDLLIQDVMLPDGDGFAFVKEMKEKNEKLPVIFLTARIDESDRILGFELGADDYITKPFGIMELLSRIKAVLRRTGTAVSTSQLITIDKLVIDLQKRNVFYDGKEAVLTYKEFEVLSYLGRHRGTAVSREKLMLNVWGFDYEGESRTVDAHIKTLRQKLEAVGCMDIVTTVRGFGYKII